MRRAACMGLFSRTANRMYRHTAISRLVHSAISAQGHLYTHVNKRTFSASSWPGSSSSHNIGGANNEEIAVKPFTAIPGPDPSRFNLLYYWRDISTFIWRPDEFYQMRHEQYPSGMFREKLGSQETVHITDPATIEEVYRQEDRYPSRATLHGLIQYMTERQRQFGVLLLENEEWHRTRKALDRVLLRPRPMLEYASLVNAVTVEFVTRLETLQQQHGLNIPIPNMDDELWMWGLESSTAIIFESRFGTFCADPSPRMKQFIQSVQYVAANMTLMVFLPPHIGKLIAPRKYKKLITALDTAHTISVEILSERLKELSVKLKRGEQPGGFLAYLVAKQQLSEKEILANVQDLMSAGGDTTAASMQWLLYLLSKNPEAQEKIFEEVSKLQLDIDDFDTSCINQMHYLKAAVKESMRIHPIIPVVGRRIKNKIVLQGYQIPPNTILLLSPVSKHATYFPEPLKFRPERWLKESEETIHPFSSIPFGLGLRMCIGRRVAELKIQLLTATLVQKFHILPGDPTPRIGKVGVIRGPSKAVSIILRKRIVE